LQFAILLRSIALHCSCYSCATSQYEVNATIAADGVAWSACRSMCPCVCHDRAPPKHGCTDRATVSFVDSGGSSEPYIIVGPYPHAKEQF